MNPHHLHRTVVCAVSTVALAALGFAQGNPAQLNLQQRTGNVLLIVADDLGVDGIRCYGEHPDAPPTPVIDSLAANGVLFRNAYTDPTCSPSRAAMLTGRYGFRTLLGQPINETQPEYSLQLAELTAPEVIGQALLPIATSAIGKWHLGSTANGGANHPNLQGFDWFQGSLGNLALPYQNYFNHVRVTNGVPTQSTTYATSEQVDDAIARIHAMPQPWVLYLAFNAPHQPFHAPPQNLHTYHLYGAPSATPAEHYRAAVQAMDTEIGRLLASVPATTLARTTVIFTADNGSPNEAVTAPFESGKAKGTLFEGGVNVPLIVSGRGVRHPGRECAHLVNSVDIYPTMLECAGLDLATALAGPQHIDGRSFSSYLLDPTQAPVRDWVFAQRFSPNGPGPYTSAGRMLRDERWKLIERAGQGDLFYDMEGTNLERDSLLPGALTPEQQAAYDALRALTVALLRS